MSLTPSLISALASKSILPLVGAGVSMSLRNTDGNPVFPSWSGLLESAADKLSKENDENSATLITTFLKTKDYQQAAKYAYDGLIHKGMWHDFIQEQFDINLLSLAEESAELPKSIWKLSNQIITLNYDKILSWAYPKNAAQVLLLRNDASANLLSILNSKQKPIVWHLHGNIEDTAKLILTPKSYSTLYSTSDQTNVEYQAAIQTLKNIVTTRSLLFIGCSLDDADLLAEINRQNTLFSCSSKQHFALIKESNKTTIQEKLKDTAINIITFEDYGSPLVDKINEMATHIPSATVSNEVGNIETIPNINTVQQFKVAFLSANPFGYSTDFQPIIKELKKLPYSIHCFPLTEHNLQNLSGFDYVFIASRVIKNRLIIEDDDACSSKIDFIDLQNNADLDDKKCVFIFTDKPIDKSIVEGIRFPALILPLLENTKSKKDLSCFTFQIFKKNNIKHYQDSCLIVNFKDITLPQNEFPKNNSNNSLIKHETKLPQIISKSIVKNFIGRNEDLVYLSHEMSKLENDNGFITIKGSGGLGKTTISKMLAIKASERGRFNGGIEFIDCEHLLNYEQFKFRIASIFNLERVINIEDYLTNNFDKKSRLLILDNFETLLQLDDSEEILNLLSFMSGFFSIIVTSRELLKIDGEIPYTLRQMTLDEAFELFVSRLVNIQLTLKEKKFVRDEIIDKLLDKNPLAIIIITSNILPSKNMFTLHDELQEDFFKISEEDLTLFDNTTDINIDRKKSLYGSILYSYNMLHDNEKKTFEKLSLFPDGIDIETFKKLNSNSKSNNVKKSILNDSILKKLLNKSLIEGNSNGIKLQSIIGRFAEKKLREREKEIGFFDSVFDFNYFMSNLLNDLLESSNIEGNNLSLSIFDKCQNNFLKSIHYLNDFSASADMKLKYLDNMRYLFTSICSLNDFIDILNKQMTSLENINLKAVNVIIECSRYYNGDFDSAYHTLKKMVPLDSLKNMDTSIQTEKTIFYSAVNIYSMEGNQAYIYYLLDINNQSFSKDIIGVELGVFKNSKPKVIDSTYFEYQYYTNTLIIEEIDEYLTNLHEKGHVERIQVSYTRAKLKPFDKELINSFVIATPYTLGLKCLMLAFCESDLEQAKKYHIEAIKNLEHIKFYHVDSIYWYAKFLKLHNEAEYIDIYTNGLELSLKYRYRYLEYLFDELENPTNIIYSSKYYPQPDFEQLNSELTESLIANRLLEPSNPTHDSA
jgi:hypothetical protein